MKEGGAFYEMSYRSAFPFRGAGGAVPVPRSSQSALLTMN